MPVRQKYSIANAKRLLRVWSVFENRLILDDEDFLIRSGVRKLAEDLRKEDENSIERCERLLSVFRDSDLCWFDAFNIGRFKPDENNLSDVLAALLNPKESHGLGYTFLIALIRKLRTNFPGKVSIKDDDIKKNMHAITVVREKGEEGTRPDIEILGPDFKIFIENKIRGGKETYINDEYQTVRQYRVLNTNSKEIGVFLSPEGKRPKCSGMLHLSINDMVNAFLESIKHEGQKRSEPAIESVRTFLRFYTFSM